MTTISTDLSLYFPLLTSGITQGTNFCCNGIYCKEGNVNKINAFSVEFVFNYTKDASLNQQGSYMTLYHFGSNYDKTGLCICLNNLTGATQIGLRQFNGSSWVDISNSFTTLTYISQTLTETYMVLFSFNKGNAQNRTFSFTIIPFNTTTYTQNSDLITKTGSHTQDFSATENWCIGSVTQILDTAPGYVSTNSYNSYPSQNIQISFIRSWQIFINVGSFTVSTPLNYSFVNQDSTKSLYNLNRQPVFITGLSESNTLEFQLGINNNNGTYTLYNTVPSSTNPVSVTGSVLLPTYNNSSLASVNNFTFSNWAVNYNNTTFIKQNITYNVVSSQTSTLNCLLKGTKILTPQGYILIEKLNIGQYIMTHTFKLSKIKNIFYSIVFPHENYLPFIIPKGKMGAFEDLYISPCHSILIGNKFYLAKNLYFESYKTNNLLYYYHIETEDYLKDTLIANGVIVETFNPNNKDELFIKKYKSLINNLNERKLLL
jgi:hypothetical protein